MVQSEIMVMENFWCKNSEVQEGQKGYEMLGMWKHEPWMERVFNPQTR